MRTGAGIVGGDVDDGIANKDVDINISAVSHIVHKGQGVAVGPVTGVPQDMRRSGAVGEHLV